MREKKSGYYNISEKEKRERVTSQLSESANEYVYMLKD